MTTTKTHNAISWIVKIISNSWDGSEPKKGKTFCKPTVEEISKYCVEKNLKVDVQHFYDYYESNGWKVGKNKMKDWQATARNWARNNYSSSQSSTAQSNNPFAQFLTQMPIADVIEGEVMVCEKEMEECQKSKLLDC